MNYPHAHIKIKANGIHFLYYCPPKDVELAGEYIIITNPIEYVCFSRPTQTKAIFVYPLNSLISLKYDNRRDDWEKLV